MFTLIIVLLVVAGRGGGLQGMSMRGLHLGRGALILLLVDVVGRVVGVLLGGLLGISMLGLYLGRGALIWLLVDGAGRVVGVLQGIRIHLWPGELVGWVCVGRVVVHELGHRRRGVVLLFFVLLVLFLLPNFFFTF